MQKTINVRKLLGNVQVPKFKYEVLIKQGYMKKPLKNRFSNQKEAMLYLNTYLSKGRYGFIRRL